VHAVGGGCVRVCGERVAAEGLLHFRKHAPVTTWKRETMHCLGAPALLHFLIARRNL
jgi:hypothetical protein